MEGYREAMSHAPTSAPLLCSTAAALMARAAEGEGEDAGKADLEEALDLANRALAVIPNYPKVSIALPAERHIDAAWIERFNQRGTALNPVKVRGPWDVNGVMQLQLLHVALSVVAHRNFGEFQSGQMADHRMI